MGLFGKNPLDKRTPYRVGVRSDAQIHAVLVLGERTVPAELLDISASGCGLRLEESHALGIKKGHALELRFTALGIGRAVVAVGIVRRMDKGEGWASYGLQFQDPESIYAQLHTKLWSFFNRREGFRITPTSGPGKLVPVRLALPTGERTELVNDLSAIGLAIRVSRAKALEVTGPCRAVLALPGRSAPFHLGLLPVHHTATPASLRIGFAVDPKATEDFDEQSDALTRYLLEAQRQMLRRKRG